MVKIQVVGDEITVAGFKMVGLKPCYAADKTNVKEILESLGKVDILVITHSLYQAAKEKAEAIGKVVVEIPDALGGGEDIVKQLIKNTLGFEIAP